MRKKIHEMQRRGVKRNSRALGTEANEMVDVSDMGSQSGDEAVDPACPKRGDAHYLLKLIQYLIQGHGTPAVAPCSTMSVESLQSL